MHSTFAFLKQHFATILLCSVFFFKVKTHTHTHTHFKHTEIDSNIINIIYCMAKPTNDRSFLLGTYWADMDTWFLYMDSKNSDQITVSAAGHIDSLEYAFAYLS